MNKLKVFFLFLITLTMLLLWSATIMKGEMPYIDQWTRGFVYSVSTSKLYVFARWVTELGSSTFLIPFTVVIGVFLWWFDRDWLASLIFSGGTLISYLLNMFIKMIVARERPRIDISASAEGYSFPSGHAMISIVCYGLLMYFLQKKLSTRKSVLIVQISFAFIIFMIGMSRYVINVHYLTDVLFGFACGYLLLISFIYIYKRIERRKDF